VIDSWVAKRSSQELRSAFLPLFERYVEPALDFIKTSSATLAVPSLPLVNLIETLCNLLEGLLPGEDEGLAAQRNIKSHMLEAKFVFACVWAIGGCLQVDKNADHRAAFSRWWQERYVDTVPFPKDGSVFDYYPDADTGTWRSWTSMLPPINFAAASAAASSDASGGFDMAAMFVPTVETVRLSYISKLLRKNGHHVMLVGGAGTGKTALLRNLLRSLDPETTVTRELPLNALYDGPLMQSALEAPSERKAASRYGPPGSSKKMVVPLDDGSLPAPDKYQTQTALELLRQGIDSQGWYDKQKAGFKQISNVQFVAAMSPAAGERAPPGRLQRQFANFVVPPPAPQDIVKMFAAVMIGHLQGPGWSQQLKQLGLKLVEATVDLHSAIVKTFLPSAVRFHYVFSLLEVAAVEVESFV
jgi:dynein heavy chain, axonemal